MILDPGKGRLGEAVNRKALGELIQRQGASGASHPRSGPPGASGDNAGEPGNLQSGSTCGLPPIPRDPERSPSRALVGPAGGHMSGAGPIAGARGCGPTRAAGGAPAQVAGAWCPADTRSLRSRACFHVTSSYGSRKMLSAWRAKKRGGGREAGDGGVGTDTAVYRRVDTPPLGCAPEALRARRGGRSGQGTSPLRGRRADCPEWRPLCLCAQALCSEEAEPSSSVPPAGLSPARPCLRAVSHARECGASVAAPWAAAQ